MKDLACCRVFFVRHLFPEPAAIQGKTIFIGRVYKSRIFSIMNSQLAGAVSPTNIIPSTGAVIPSY
jgi:hypothetical protein